MNQEILQVVLSIVAIAFSWVLLGVGTYWFRKSSPAIQEQVKAVVNIDDFDNTINAIVSEIIKRIPADYDERLYLPKNLLESIDTAEEVQVLIDKLRAIANKHLE